MSDDLDLADGGNAPLLPEPSRPAAPEAVIQAQQLRQDLAELLQAAAVDRKLARATGRQVLRSTRALLDEVRKAVDHREVAAGLVGLTAGEVLGGAVGGVAGALVAGPVGAVVGAEVGAFAAGTLGLKFGTEAVRDFVDDTAPGVDGASPAEQAPDLSAGYLKRTAAAGRYGRTLGFASGGSVGRLIGGKRGGLIGALLGEAAGGYADAAAAKQEQERDEGAGTPPLQGGRSNWLDRFGKNMVGEASMMLAAGTVGSVFGAGGRVLGQRLGLIVGTQIAWHRLIQPVEEPPVPAVMPPDLASEPGPARAGAATEQGSAGHLGSTLDQERETDE